jgi:hypothetical protein
MATIKHPYTGRARLQWEKTGTGVHMAIRVQEAKYRRGASYDVRETFAIVRPTYNEAGVFADNGMFLVTRGSFDDLSAHNTLDEAKVYVEALFALEN